MHTVQYRNLMLLTVVLADVVLVFSPVVCVEIHLVVVHTNTRTPFAVCVVVEV